MAAAIGRDRGWHTTGRRRRPGRPRPDRRHSHPRQSRGLAPGRAPLRSPLADHRGRARRGPHEITAGELRLSVVVDHRSASLCVDGTEVARTTEWWRSGRWRASAERGVIVIDDARSPAHAAYAVAPSPSQADGGGRVVPWLSGGCRSNPHVADGVGRPRAGRRPSGHHHRRSRRGNGTDRLRNAAVADRWRRLWLSTFASGNDDHSG